MRHFKILTINPGSTSTKIAVFEDEELKFEEVLRHSAEELGNYNNINEQLEFRYQVIENGLKGAGIVLEELDCIVGRGGLLKPISGGVYKVGEKMVEDLASGIYGEHASNLGGMIAKDMGDRLGKPSFIVDPVVVDEMEDVAKISGFPELERKSIFHALNQKAVARRFSRETDRDYNKVNLIVAHMGGGISVGLHKKGRVVDVNNALDGEGPFSPERAGTVPAGQLLKACFSGNYTLDFLKKRLKGNGGVMAYLGTNDMREVTKAAKEGDEKAGLVLDAMTYQIAKEIGGLAAAAKGEIDAILLTGGLAYSEDIINMIKDRVNFIAPVHSYPGEDEMGALAIGGLRILKGEEQPKEY